MSTESIFRANISINLMGLFIRIYTFEVQFIIIWKYMLSYLKFKDFYFLLVNIHV